MPKKYEYFIVLTKSSGVYHTSFHITKILDHPINNADIAHFEKTDRGLEVINWKLLSVTGTFAYRLIFSWKSPLGNIYLKSLPWSLGHKITAITIKKDYETINAQMDYFKVLMGIDGEVEILLHQEIPDD